MSAAAPAASESLRHIAMVPVFLSLSAALFVFRSGVVGWWGDGGAPFPLCRAPICNCTHQNDKRVDVPRRSEDLSAAARGWGVVGGGEKKCPQFISFAAALRTVESMKYDENILGLIDMQISQPQGKFIQIRTVSFLVATSQNNKSRGGGGTAR